MPAADTFKQNSILTPPKNSFLQPTNPQEVRREHSARCGTNVTLSMYPMPERWQERLYGVASRPAINSMHLLTAKCAAPQDDRIKAFGFCSI